MRHVSGRALSVAIMDTGTIRSQLPTRTPDCRQHRRPAMLVGDWESRHSRRQELRGSLVAHQGGPASLCLPPLLHWEALLFGLRLVDYADWFWLSVIMSHRVLIFLGAF